MYSVIAIVALSAALPGIYAPIPPCSPLRFVNHWVESPENAWLFDGLPGHPQVPCAYENEAEAPAADRSILAHFLGTPGRLEEQLRADGYWWSNIGLSRLNDRFWQDYDGREVAETYVATEAPVPTYEEDHAREHLGEAHFGEEPLVEEVHLGQEHAHQEHVVEQDLGEGHLVREHVNNEEELHTLEHVREDQAHGHHAKKLKSHRASSLEDNVLIRHKRGIFGNPFEGLFDLFSSETTPYYDEREFNGYDDFGEHFTDYDTQPFRQPLNVFNGLAEAGIPLPPAEFAPQPIYSDAGEGGFHQARFRRSTYSQRKQ